jgi:hypothetical protein
MDGIQNVGPKNFNGSSNSNPRIYKIKGTNPAIPPIIEPAVLSGVRHYWYNHYNSLQLENLLIHHTWNYSFSESASDSGGLITLYINASVVLENVMITTLYPSLLSQTPIIHSMLNGNNVTFINSYVQNIGLAKVSLFYDFTNCLYNLTNTSIANIQSLFPYFLYIILF